MIYTRQAMRRVFIPVVRKRESNKKRCGWSSYCGGVDLKGELVTPCERTGYLWPNISKTLPQITCLQFNVSHEVKGYFNLADCQTQVIKSLIENHSIFFVITRLKGGLFRLLRHFNDAIFQAVRERAR